MSPSEWKPSWRMVAPSHMALCKGKTETRKYWKILGIYFHKWVRQKKSQYSQTMEVACDPTKVSPKYGLCWFYRNKVKVESTYILGNQLSFGGL